MIMNLELYRAYNTQYVEAIHATIDTMLFVTRKWQESDYIWPFSDMDYRYVLKTDVCVDFFALNESIYQIHIAMQHQDVHCQRILEHPPGYFFFVDETENVYFEDYRVWSFAGGNAEAFRQFQAHLDAREDFDTQYYHKILAKRLKKFSLETEFAGYDSPQLAVYNAYCVLWHYAFPCLFALHSLYRRRSVRCKVCLAWLENPLLKTCYTRMYAGAPTESLPPMDELIDAATAEILKTADLLGIPTDNLGISVENGVQYFEAVAMLRTRMARMLLYLEEDAVDRVYLANREIVELTNLFDSIAQHNGTDTDRQVCTLLHQDQSAVEKVRMLRNYMLENKTYYNNLMNQRFGGRNNGLLNGKN